MPLPSSAPAGYVQQSVTTAAALSTIPAQATFALINVESGAIRWRDDGTNPTASVGTPLSAGQTLTYDGSLAALKVVSQSGTSVLSVAYYVSRHP